MTMTVSIPANVLADKETAPFTALCFTTQTTLATLSDWNHVPDELYTEADRLGLQMVGPIQYIYTGITGDMNNEFQVDIAFPISAPADSAGTFSYKTFAGFRCAACTYRGPWADFPAVYDALFEQFYASGRRTNQLIREVYAVVDFENPANCLTEIQIGLA